MDYNLYIEVELKNTFLATVQITFWEHGGTVREPIYL